MTTWSNNIGGVWHLFVGGLTLLLAVLASGHALLYKRDTRAATLWVGFIWLVPLLGSVLYFIFGVNRIKRQAILLRGNLERYRSAHGVTPCRAPDIENHLSPAGRHLSLLGEVVDKVAVSPLLPGNRVEPFINGDAAYPVMLEAIAQAEKSISLATYIFDRDASGMVFARALSAAVRRGVEVRVLIDASGARYSWPPIHGVLRREGIRHASFLPTMPRWRFLSMNLRNHRKILVTDGRIGFTGGMNIRAGNCLVTHPAHPIQDIQFRVEGPVVAHFQEIFVDDWFFTTREALRGEKWFPPLQKAGSVLSRGIADGPDEDFEKLRWTILGALAAARRSVRIATPYFLPDPTIISALNLAALRGVAVEILLPAQNNLKFVQWASTAHWWQVLGHGCRIWLSPPPFDHSKLFIVDDSWALLGSANWDPRSLRLNFEFNVECYDEDLAARLTGIFEAKRAQSRAVTLRDVDSRSLPVRLRDGVARLLTPFL